MIVTNQAGAGPSNAPDNGALAPAVDEPHDDVFAEPSGCDKAGRWCSNKTAQFVDGWHAFSQFMWNRDKGQVMGRKGKSWAQILFFYVCFYTFLAGYFVALFAIFFQTISQDRPTYNSLITPPGLNLVPFPDRQRRIEYGTANGDEDRVRIEREIQDNVFSVFDNVDFTMYEECPDTPGEITDPPRQRFCRYDPSLLGPCAPGTNTSGYDTAEPCLYMGLNKVWGWIPESYSKEELELRYSGILNTSIDFTNKIIFSCNVRVQEDARYVDFIRVFPEEGVSFGHYPYVVGTDQAQQARYIRPVVAVKVGINTRDVDVRLECRALALNIPFEAPGGLFNSREEPSQFRIRIMVRK